MDYIIIFFIALFLIPKTITFFSLFQQNSYKINKYAKNLKKHYLKTISTYLEYLASSILLIYIFYKEWYIAVLSVFFLLGAYMLTENLIIYPKFTKRLMRLLITFILINLIPFIFIDNYLIICLSELVFMPLILIFAALINKPIESIINKYYKKQAKQKLSQIKPLIIGITGSYGKTSTKNILNTLINQTYYTYSTPKSYNTPMGICKSIKNMNWETEVFITELGATTKGDILELVEFVPVKIGIITDIGPQHLESFKTIENVLMTKLEILQSKNIKQLVINNDNEYLRTFDYPKNINVVRIGIEEKADLMAKNLELTNKGISFEVYQNEEYLLKVESHLLGRHNVYNILLSMAVAQLLDIKNSEIAKNIPRIKAVDNRLSLTNIGNIQILNDAFNSNIKGFVSAIEILKLSKNQKILITPGIVDLGGKSEELNKEIGKHLIKDIDYIYLVENEAALFIKDYFIEHHFMNYELVSSFKEAYKKAVNKYSSATILIENDLPDNYLRR